MPYITVNGIQVYVGWSCYIAPIQNVSGLNCQLTNASTITNSTSPLGAVQNSVFNTAMPWLMPVFTFMLYIYLLSIYADSPQRGKMMMIAALVLVISIFLALGGYLADAIANYLVFVAAFVLTRLFRGV